MSEASAVKAQRWANGVMGRAGAVLLLFSGIIYFFFFSSEERTLKFIIAGGRERVNSLMSAE